MSVLWFDSSNTQEKKDVAIRSSIAFSDNQAVDLHNKSRPTLWMATPTLPSSKETSFTSVELEASRIRSIPLSAAVLSAQGHVQPEYLSMDELRRVNHATSRFLHSQNRDAEGVLQALAEEAEDLHEILWASEVRVEGSGSPLIVMPTPREEGLSRRVLALEEQLVLHARIIRDQQRTIGLYERKQLETSSTLSPVEESPFEAEEQDEKEQIVQVHQVTSGSHSSSADIERLVAERAQKDSIISQMDRAMANYEEQTDKLQASLKARDMVLSQRQAELSSKDEEISTLKALMQLKERQNQWLRQELLKAGHKVTMPRELEESLPVRTSHLPDRSSIARRIAMRSSPGASPKSADTSSLGLAHPPLDLSSSLQDISLSESALDHNSSSASHGGIHMSQEVLSVRSEVQDRLAMMSRNRMSVYSPRSSSIPYSVGGRLNTTRPARIMGPMKESNHERESTTIVTL